MLRTQSVFPLFVFVLVLTEPLRAQITPEPAAQTVQKLAFDGPRTLSVPARTIDGFILVVDPIGSKPRRLTDGQSPTWSPDGNQIAYCVREGAAFGQLQLINADGSGHHELTHLKGGACLPDWSPDGSKIAFTAYTNKIPITAAIVVIDKDGQNDTQIAEGYDPKWSPDGRQLLFTRDSEKQHGKGSIWVINPDGTGANQVAEFESEDPEPNWFPDGRKIAFSSLHEKKSVIFSVNLDGSGLREVIGQEKFDCYFPVISPDGKEFVVDVLSAGKEPSVVLIDGATRQGTLLAHGTHPSIVWRKR